MIDIEAVFSSAKRHGRGWMAKCPVHDDRKASLSIGTGDDGKILLKCFAGCSLDDIVAAAHLELADLFPEKPTTTSTIVATYRYVDEQGRHLFDVCRTSTKDFPRWTWQAQARAAVAAGGLAWKATTHGRPAPPVDVAVTPKVNDSDA